jgi:hypothetical protein
MSDRCARVEQAGFKSSERCDARANPLTARAATARAHALFRRFPLSGTAELSVGTVPTPYHVYDGCGAFIGGTASLEVARRLLEREQVVPVRTVDGKAVMGIWVFAFTDASLGAHHELQISLFVSRGEVEPLSAHSLALLQAMIVRPDIRMLCHGLWNSTPIAVAYNRELLGLDARLSESRIEADSESLRFAVGSAGAAVLEGHIDRPGRGSPLAGLGLLWRLGLRRTAALARQPWIRVPVLNPVGPTLQRNAVADSYTKADAVALRHFHPERDRLVFGSARYGTLHFAPQFVQTMNGFKFVYTLPR